MRYRARLIQGRNSMTEWRDTDHIDPGGHWLGWKLRGRVLVSPDHDRITPERLRGLLFCESLRLRRDKARAVLQRGVIVASFADRVRELRPDAGISSAGEA